MIRNLNQHYFVSAAILDFTQTFNYLAIKVDLLYSFAMKIYDYPSKSYF